MVRPRTFFDFTIEGTPAGRVVFELFNDIAPKTVEKYVCPMGVPPRSQLITRQHSFRALCTGELGKSKINEDVTLHYKGSFIHRSIANFMVQGGGWSWSSLSQSSPDSRVQILRDIMERAERVSTALRLLMKI